MKDYTPTEEIAMLCHLANEHIARIALSVNRLPSRRGAILLQTKAAGDALGAILRECDRVEEEEKKP